MQNNYLSQSDFDKILFDLDQIVYCAEGNSTIVVSNPSLGLILRIRKEDDKTKVHKRSRGFINPVELSTNPRIQRYFGTCFTRRPRLVSVTPAFLLKLEHKISSDRPAYRKTKGVKKSERYIVVTADAAQIPRPLRRYAFGCTLSVELKPKFGAIIIWPCTGPENLVKTSSCQFCLRQYHPSKTARWPQPSLYCPCDLFSGSRRRMLRSLYALVRTPQVNFRVHLDGQVCFSHEGGDLDKTIGRFFTGGAQCETVKKENGTISNGLNGYHRNGIHSDIVSRKSESHKSMPNHKCSFTDNRDRLFRGLVLDALLCELEGTDDSSVQHEAYLTHPPFLSLDCLLHKMTVDDDVLAHPKRRNSQDPSVDCSSYLQPENSTDVPLPPKGSILGRVFATQLLTRTDVCYVVPHYERVCQFLSTHELLWDDYIQLPPKERFKFLLGSTDLIESFSIVERYLISLVARDCSIMLTFQRATNDCPDWACTIGGTCDCLPRMIMNPVIIDLDPKSLENIRGRFRIEQSIAQNASAWRPDFLALLERT
ncbi:unnamed protein product [Calicophoron daubneyi]|uniref:Inositol-pentakisphosphate 2-kinase n=1 Tax=Calicophoron daubneyi TaxID=300641 RepID=A0AAV2TLP8_CALDB